VINVQVFYSFINDILTHFNQNIGDLFSIDELELFILLFADDTGFCAFIPISTVIIKRFTSLLHTVESKSEYK